MSPPFGSSPLCARCETRVYAAEQVMGPGRKIYHKPCLNCTSCKKRLDSFSLLDHESEPYCKTCHTKLFGTRDLRSANVANSGSLSAPSTPPRVIRSAPTSPFSKQELDPNGLLVPGGSVAVHSTGQPPVRQLQATLTGTVTRSGAFGGTPICARCEKAVYMAEQVSAIGKKWHKGCLRCVECSTSLASGRLADREGKPYCHSCYSKAYGPAGLAR